MNHAEYPVPKTMFHHGTCDSCGKKNCLIIHFGYNQQISGNNYRICKNCFGEAIFTW